MKQLLFLFIITFGQIVSAQINSKKTCFYHGWKGEFGRSNNNFIGIAKTYSIRRARKLNLFNSSKPTQLGLGLMIHTNTPLQKAIITPNLKLEMGFIKLKHFRPTVRYSYLVNVDHSHHRISAGLSYLPLKNCGLHYEYHLIDPSGFGSYSLKHTFGVTLNFLNKKIGCLNAKKKKPKKKD